MRCKLWSYDIKTGGIFQGAKMVASTLDFAGEAFAGDHTQAFRFGQMIVNKMNEINTRPRKPLGRTREVK